MRGRDPGVRAAARHYVQRLATIAHGDGVCTTHVPATVATVALYEQRPLQDWRARHYDALHPRNPDPGRADRRAGALRVRLGRHRRRRCRRATRPVRRRRARHLGPEERAGVDAGAPAQGPGASSARSRCRPGARTCPASTSTTSSTSCARPRSRPRAWDDLPEDIKNTYDRLGIPEAEKQRLVSGVAAQYESEVVYHKIREDLEEQGVIFLDTDTALREHPELFQRVLRHGHPGRRQQVRRAEHRGVVGRLVHLRAQGRARRHPAAGLLPHQHREHGPVRADADHRRRGRLRALRRGLHRADLQVGLAALRRRRDHREEGRPLPLHDHPELVEQRLQPGHQAGHRAGRRDHGVDRRQHRVQGHDEVPGRLADGRARQGRDALGRVRRRGPAPGRRRQDGALRAAHQSRRSSPSRSPAAAAAPPTAAWSRCTRAPTTASRR